MDSSMDIMKQLASAFAKTPHGYVHFMLTPVLDQLGKSGPMTAYSVELRREDAPNSTEVSFTLTAVFDVSGEFAGDDMKFEHGELVWFLRAFGFTVADEEAANPDVSGNMVRVIACMPCPKPDTTPPLAPDRGTAQ